jgi:predicted Fe-Mo cluster-binding NifX family protein
MKIAVACEDLMTVACHLGRAPLFLVYDDAGGKLELVDQRRNEQANHGEECRHDGEQHHAHHDHGSILARVGDCGIVISRGMGRRVAADFAARGIRALVVEDNATPLETAALALAGRGVREGGFCGCHDTHAHTEATNG